MLALNFRSLRYSVFEAPPHKWLVIAIVWELAMLVVLLQFDAVRDAFGIAMPSWSSVGFVLATGVAIMLTIEAAKIVLRRRQTMQFQPA
jgi:P-type Ca2+ transporter type 2C